MYGNLVGHQSMWDNVDMLADAAGGPPNRVTEQRFQEDVAVANHLLAPQQVTVKPPDSSMLMAGATRTRESQGNLIHSNVQLAAAISGPQHPPSSPTEEVLAASTPNSVAGYNGEKSAYIQPDGAGYQARAHPGVELGPQMPMQGIPHPKSGGSEINVSSYDRPNYRVDSDRDLSRLI